MNQIGPAWTPYASPKRITDDTNRHGSDRDRSGGWQEASIRAVPSASLSTGTKVERVAVTNGERERSCPNERSCRHSKSGGVGSSFAPRPVAAPPAPPADP